MNVFFNNCIFEENYSIGGILLQIIYNNIKSQKKKKKKKK